MIESDFQQAIVEKVSLSNMGFVMVLKSQTSNETVPIFIGASEAHAISVILNKQNVPRPLSHDLFKNALDILGAKVHKVYITDMSEDTFFALLCLEYDGKLVDIDARPSDAIGLALRFHCPIYVHRDVFKDVKEDQEKEEEMIRQATEEEEEGKGQLETYRDALQKAIQDERYEDAAKLRDQILTLQKHQ